MSFTEIEANDFNLNIPRYIDSGEPEDIHDLGAHLNGDIPERDVGALDAYWKVFPTLRRALFAPGDRPGYAHARGPASEVRNTVLEHREFAAFGDRVLAGHDAGASRRQDAPGVRVLPTSSRPCVVCCCRTHVYG